MGIPKFYRWLSERYPRINQKIDNSELPEFDAMYLDANGIVHVCSHPNDEEVSDVIPFADMIVSCSPCLMMTRFSPQHR